MTIRLLEDHDGLKKGVRDVSDKVGLNLISKGFAVKVEKEKAIDREAHEALVAGKQRDEQ